MRHPYPLILKLGAPNRIRSMMLLFVACVMLLSCTVKLMYRQLDWVIPWYMKDYLTLTDQQAAFLESQLQQHLHWHRHSELPNYAALLRQLARDIEDGLSREELTKQQTAIRDMSRRLATTITPDIVKLLVSSDQTQLTELYAKFEQDNRRYAKRTADKSDAEIRRTKAANMEKQIERWTGRLADNQLALIDSWSQAIHLTHIEWLEYRRHWQNRFKSLIAQRDENDQVQDELIGLFSRPEDDWPPDYQALTAANSRLLTQLLLDVDATLSSKQRARAIKKLNGFAEDFDDLAAEKP